MKMIRGHSITELSLGELTDLRDQLSELLMEINQLLESTSTQATDASDQRPPAPTLYFEYRKASKWHPI